MSGEKGSYLGYFCSLSVGDVNDDGVTELLVGASADDSDSGTVWVVSGSSPGVLAGQASMYANPTLEGAEPGNLLATMGPYQADVTGDGLTDVALGGSDYSDGDNVALAVYAGSSSLIATLDPSSAELVLHGSTSETCQLASHLDMDGDGVAEVVFADWSGEDSVGACPVYLLQLDGISGSGTLSDTAHSELRALDSNDELGRAMGGGDFDGDGLDDLLLGAPGNDEAGSDAGSVSVLLGGDPISSWEDMEESAYAVFLGSSADARLGEGPPGLGDLDGDGNGDLVLCEPGSAQLLVFFDSATRADIISADQADLTIAGTSDSRLGQSLALGDFDRDGLQDVAAGMPGNADPAGLPVDGSQQGGLLLYAGTDLSAGATVPMASLSPADHTMLGYGVTTADLDSDGFDDLLVSAPQENGTGRVWLLLMP